MSYDLYENLARHTLETVLYDFRAMKKLGDGALAQLDDESIGWAPDSESNSASVIVKHLAGNMISRWTDFLNSDGEKPYRNRDHEFVDDVADLEALRALWENGWSVVFGALEPLAPEDLMREVTIRGQPHTVLQAIHRQISHYAYHTGQLVYVAKARKSADWRTLSIPKGGSVGFNERMNEQFGK
ncbi:DUF1572 domain-containing protein [Cohnella pontilimi]|uniref:DUF1572 domain-containing protein n=1 Tax=Cohnella pontilimi TaxID=2564100 RepID=A0A4U0FF63_9BACL|nr:DUF1572 family protein [Cohnella pontilimi]TJY43468.1 DUF1572 domain-containing protein [Cohnella pontilimi]